MEALTRDRAGQHSIRINDQWRLCFAWRDGAPHEIEIVDCHQAVPSHAKEGGMDDLILREDLDSADLSNADAGEAVPPVMPGQVLCLEFMEPAGLSAHALAKATGLPINRITAIPHGTRGITADTALRLARRFGTSAEMWMNLQTAYDLETARKKMAA